MAVTPLKKLVIDGKAPVTLTECVYLGDGTNKTLKEKLVELDNKVPDGGSTDPNSHTHANKTVLDGITEQKVAEWDTNGNGGTNVQLNSVTQSTFNFKEENGVFTVASVGDKNISFPVREGNLVMRDIIDGEIFEIGDIIPPPVIVYGNIVLSTSSLSVNEKATNTFTVKLDKAPNNNQLVSLSVNNAYCTLNKTSLTFTPSDYATPQTVTITGVHDTIHYSNKNSIVTVSSQKVTNKTVAVTIVNIDEQPSETIAVTSISLDKNTATIKVDGTVQLVAVIQPPNATNKNVIWSANNANVEVTQQGLVTGKVMGNSIVTVTTEDGSKIATCNVVIEAKEVTPEPPIQSLNPTIRNGLTHMYDFRKVSTGDTSVNDEVGSMNISFSSEFSSDGYLIYTGKHMNCGSLLDNDFTCFLITRNSKGKHTFYCGDRSINDAGIKVGTTVTPYTTSLISQDSIEILCISCNSASKIVKAYTRGLKIGEATYTSTLNDKSIYISFSGDTATGENYALLVYNKVLSDTEIETVSKDIDVIQKDNKTPINFFNKKGLVKLFDYSTASSDMTTFTSSIPNDTVKASGAVTFQDGGIVLGNQSLSSKYAIPCSKFTMFVEYTPSNQASGNKIMECSNYSIFSDSSGTYLKLGTAQTSKYDTIPNEKNVVAMSYNSDTQDAKLYVNGMLKETKNFINYVLPALEWYSLKNTLIIHKHIAYNRVLSDEEVLLLNNHLRGVN